MRPLAAIIARARGGVIGDSKAALGMPWHFPEDLAHFRKLTTGHAILMGRKTFALIGRPLPRRRNLVITRSPASLEGIAGIEAYASLEAVLTAARAEDELPFVIGGASIFTLAMPQITQIYLTEIDREVAGDAYFPALPEDEFQEVDRCAGVDPALTFVSLQRKCT